MNEGRPNRPKIEKPKTQDAEAGPEDLAREAALRAFREKGQDNEQGNERGEHDPEAVRLYTEWMLILEERRDRGEISEGEVTISSIQFLLDAGMEEEARESCEEILANYEPPAEEGSSQEDTVSPDGQLVYDFCRKILES